MTRTSSEPMPALAEAVFFPTPGGNTGDDLIATGCRYLLTDSGLEVAIADGGLLRDAAVGDLARVTARLGGFRGLIFFSGGGTLGIYPENETMRATVIAAAPHARGFLVFPQSGPVLEPALLDDRVTVLARDAVTHRMLGDAGAATGLVPDAALLASRDIELAPGGTGTFWILRSPGRDLERTEHDLVPDGPVADLTYDLPLDAVLDYLRPIEWVVTDRLHGGLIALMMGKPVGLLPVSYHKTRAFYDTWLSDDPGVAFLTSSAELDAFRSSTRSPGLAILDRARELSSSALTRFLDDRSRGHRGIRRPAVVVGAPSIAGDGPGRTRLSATIDDGDSRSDVWFSVPEAAPPPVPPSEPFVLAALLHAMRHRKDLVVEGPVSATMLANLEGLQEVYAGWFPELFARVSVVAEPSAPLDTVSPVAAACFSGGVDSFHTVMTHRQRLDALLYVDGLDMVDPDPAFRRMVHARIVEAADEVGLPLLVATTNVREYATPFAAWAEHFHAMALATVGHAISGGLGELLIPADRSYSTAIPWANHPMTTPLYSSEAVRFTPSGWEGTRADRVMAIASYPPALRHLRVCWRNPESAYNCGRCEEGVRTKLGLDLAGALDAAVTLDDHFDPAEYAAFDVDPGNLAHIVSHLAAARRLGRDDIAEVLQSMLDEHRRVDLAATASNAFSDLIAVGDDGAGVVASHRDTLYRTLSAHHGRWLSGLVLRDVPGKVVQSLWTTFRQIIRRITRR